MGVGEVSMISTSEYVFKSEKIPRDLDLISKIFLQIYRLSKLNETYCLINKSMIPWEKLKNFISSKVTISEASATVEQENILKIYDSIMDNSITSFDFSIIGVKSWIGFATLKTNFIISLGEVTKGLQSNKVSKTISTLLIFSSVGINASSSLEWSY